MKRSNQKIITTRSRVIRYMRISKRISQTSAGDATGCSKAAIGHYETGRMDLADDRARRLVEHYGFEWKEFEDYLSGKPLPVLDLKDECFGLLDRISSEDKLRAVHTILQSFIA